MGNKVILVNVLDVISELRTSATELSGSCKKSLQMIYSSCFYVLVVGVRALPRSAIHDNFEVECDVVVKIYQSGAEISYLNR